MLLQLQCKGVDFKYPIRNNKKNCNVFISFRIHMSHSQHQTGVGICHGEGLTNIQNYYSHSQTALFAEENPSVDGLLVKVTYWDFLIQYIDLSLSIVFCRLDRALSLQP